MKKVSILLLLIVAIATFGFISYGSTTNSQISPDKDEVSNLTVLKGAEKSGFTESNQNW